MQLFLKCKSALIAALLKKVDFRYFLLPVVVAVVVGWLLCQDIYGNYKPVLERIALIMLSGFTVITLLRLILKREPFFLWASVLLAVLFCREIHFEGSDELLYVGVGVLFAVALIYNDALKPFLNRSFTLTFLAMGFFSYFLGYTLDQRWWQFIPGEDIFSSRLEEFMEVFSHCVIGVTLIVARKIPGDTDKGSSGTE